MIVANFFFGHIYYLKIKQQIGIIICNTYMNIELIIII